MPNAQSTRWFTRFFPFLSWFAEMTPARLRDDAIAGITVALVLIPQSMAYAQLAGLPAYYGLYAAFLPPTIAALFGSSRQLATGPVAIVSLMSAAALEPLATSGGAAYCAYALLLSLMVGVFQLSLGVLRLGVIVNFISHPVVNGFTNAAAIIIATSQLSKVFGVYVDKGEHHYETIYRVVEAAIHYTHWPTLVFALGAFIIMFGLKRINPRIPNVLVAVALATTLSWAFGFECNSTASIDAIMDQEANSTITVFDDAVGQLTQLQEQRTTLGPQIEEAVKQHGEHSVETTRLRQQVALIELQIEAINKRIHVYRDLLRNAHFEAVDSDGKLAFYRRGQVPGELQSDGAVWRIRVGRSAIKLDNITMTRGGEVVSTVPKGLPGFSLPSFDLSAILHLLSMVMIISLLGFMEAVSIAKAMAAKTGQRLDPNQELIGQGLANIVGSMTMSYPTSGSFSRSAVNLQAGAVSGLASVFTTLVVVIALLFLTPLLYYLPQAVLAAIIMVAVVGLLNVSGFIHAWKAQRYDGMISIISFASTLYFAPHLDRGIMIGIVLSIGLYLGRNMKPLIKLLSLHEDGTYRNAERFHLERCRHISVIRFSGTLFFANAGYLEERVLEQVRLMPELRHVVVVGNGINELDASGEEMLSMLVSRLRESGYEISFTGLNDAVLDVLRRTGLQDKIGEDHLFRNVQKAIDAIHASAHHASTEHNCPLQHVVHQASLNQASTSSANV